MTNKRSIKSVYMAVLAFCLFVFGLFGGRQELPAFADERVYTNVLADLQKDEAFDVANYPAVADDYSVQLIQIAESKENELLVYTYEPSREMRKLDATSINISTDKDETLADMPEHSINYRVYSLELLSESGVFAKYRVKDFEIQKDALRFYNITTIRRAWCEDIDDATEGGNTISEVPYAVAKQYTAYTYNGEVLYTCLETDTITVTDKYVGFMRYKDGFHLFPAYEACDAHFVAFNTDKDIDRLYEADVYYTEQGVVDFMLGYPTYQFDIVFGPIAEKYAYLNSENKQGYAGSGWWHYTYSWKEIETAEAFIANENRTDMYEHGIFDVSVKNSITDTGYANIKDKKWVLRFAATAYSHDVTTDSTITQYSIIQDVSILRLKFETDGTVYNLGVVDNKQSGRPNDPDNEQTETVSVTPPKNWLKRLLDFLFGWIGDVPWWVWLIVGAVVLIILLPVLSAVFPAFGLVLAAIFKAIAKAFVWLFKGLWWLVSLPFRGIAALIRKIKNR